MKNKILWSVTLLPMIITAVVIKFLPDSVPMHYDAYGNIDRWGSKYEQFIFPVIIVFCTLMWYCFIAFFKKKQVKATEDKERAEAVNNEKLIYWVAVGMAFSFGVMHYFFMYSAFIEARADMSKMAIDSSIVVNVIMGVFMMFLGNMLPKAKPNAVAGVRTVWSMHNDKTWAASNRFGGAALMVCGLLTIIESLIIGGIVSTFVMLGLIIVFAIVSTVYSYRMYEKYK